MSVMDVCGVRRFQKKPVKLQCTVLGGEELILSSFSFCSVYVDDSSNFWSASEDSQPCENCQLPDQTEQSEVFTSHEPNDFRCLRQSSPDGVKEPGEVSSSQGFDCRNPFLALLGRFILEGIRERDGEGSP